MRRQHLMVPAGQLGTNELLGGQLVLHLLGQSTDHGSGLLGRHARRFPPLGQSKSVKSHVSVLVGSSSPNVADPAP
jgi:hypothetical protein